MQIDNLIQIVDTDLETLKDQQSVILKYVESIDRFSNLVKINSASINYKVARFLQNILTNNDKFIKENNSYTWKVIGGIDDSYEDNAYLFSQEWYSELQIKYDLLDPANFIKSECICRIEIKRSGMKTSFDMILRSKHANLLMQSQNYNNYLKKLQNGGLEVYEKNGKPTGVSGSINIHEYRTLTNYQKVMTDIFKMNQDEINDFKIIYRGDEYEGNQQSFQTLFEKILDSASCLK